MLLNITHDGISHLNVSADEARDKGLPGAAIGSALKAAYLSSVAATADAYRARLATASAGKLAEYRIKEEIARDPSIATDAELSMLTREAEARGTDRETLLAQIGVQAAAYRQIALLIGALEAETGAAITAIDDDALDIEEQIQTVLSAAVAQAEDAFTEAQALLNGG